MIENPKNLTEQLLNLVERVAIEIKAIYNKLKTATFKVNGISPDAEGNVEITSVAEASKASKDGNGNIIADTYLTKTGKATSAGSADTATKATQDALGNDIATTYATKTENNAKAPTSHASTATTYGIGSESNYGHVKLSDSTSSTSAASAGIAASPKAVKSAYDLANLANTNASVAATTANEAKTAADSSIKTINNTSPDSSGNVDLVIPSGVHVSDTAPEDGTSVWLDTSAEATIDSLVTSVNGNTGDITPEQTGCLPLSGGNVTGMIEREVSGSVDNYVVKAFNATSGHAIAFGIGARQTNRGIWDTSTSSWMINFNENNVLQSAGKDILRSTSGTTDLTAGTSALETGTVYLMYE